MPPTTTPAMQRAASLVHLPPLLAELGVGLEEVLEDTGVSIADLAPERYIPYASYLRILDRAAERTRCADFGLRLGSRQTLAALGPVGRLMSCAATLGEALSDFVAFQIGNSTGGAVYLHRSGDEFAFGYGSYDPAARASHQMYDLVVAIGLRLIHDLTAGKVEPLEILMIGRAPGDLAPYRALTTGPIRFDQSEACLILAKADLEFPLPTADRAARDALFPQLHQRLLQAPWGMSSRVRHALRSLMIAGFPSMPEVAAHLDLHLRTLRRELDREGTTFERIKDEIRYAVARQLLSLTQLAAAEVGMSVGYGTPSAFIRAFQRWSGVSPTEWRRRLRDGQVHQ